MTYNPNIPQPSDKISQSQGQILTNFTQANVVFNNDHFQFNNASNAGLHRQIQFPIIPTPPTVAGAAGALYTAADASSITQLFFKNATQTIQITGLSSAFGPGLSGWTTLPSGIKMAWGYDLQASAGSNQYTVNYNGGSGVTFTNVFTVQISTINLILSSGSGAMLNNNLPGSGTYINRGFDQNNIYYFTSSGSIKGITWLAIGN